MLIQVVALACTVQAAPLRCKDVNLTFAAEAMPTPMQCAMNGQIELAKWVRDHPQWYIHRGFKCGSLRAFAKA